MSRINKDRTNWLGACLLVIGILYLYRHHHWNFFYMADWFPHYHLGWEALLVGIGLVLLIFGRGLGLVLLIVGLYFWLPYGLHDIFTQLQQWWPVALIICGLVLLSQSRKIINN